MKTRNIASFVVPGSVCAILFVTLWPSRADTDTLIPFWCLLCGSRGIADGFLNILLFIPLGMGIALLPETSPVPGRSFRKPLTALLGSLALSGSIELAQIALPGRFPSAGDLVLNSLGGLAGWAVLLWSRDLRRRNYRLSPREKAFALLLPPTVFLASALVSAPTYPKTTYYGQWTHELGRLMPYSGTVLSASVGAFDLPDRTLPDQAGARRALQKGEPLQLTVVIGPRPTDPSHVFAIYDEEPGEILQLGVQGSDLFFQRRTLSSDLYLDYPLLLWRGVMERAVGDTVSIEIRQTERNLCISVNGERRCDLTAGVEGGWRLLYRVPGAPGVLVAFLGGLWLALLSFPAGFLSRGKAREGWIRALSAGLVIGAAGGLISWATPWFAFHLVQVLAPVAGVLAGRGVRLFLEEQAWRCCGDSSI